MSLPRLACRLRQAGRTLTARGAGSWRGRGEGGDTEGREEGAGGSLVALALGSLLAGTWLLDQRRRGHLALPAVRAAEPLEGGEGGEGGGKPSRRQAFNFIADVVSETAPSLVYIEIKDTGFRDYFTGQPVTHSNGSGFIVSADGLVLTNAHVVVNKPRAAIVVRLADGKSYNAVVEDVDMKSDLATVRISAPGPLPTVRLGCSASLRPGEWVVALGSPLSLSNTITTGVVSNKARPPDEMGLQGRDLPEYIQTDAAITFGNSGGPLINLDGEVIGINSMKVTPGISFAIPIDYAKEFLRKSQEAAQGGSVLKERRFIGITMITLNHQLVEELKARTQLPASVTHGILVHRVVQGGPAHRAGILTGDILTHINTQPVHGSRDVYKLLEGGEELVCTVVRDMKAFRVTVKPEAYHA